MKVLIISRGNGFGHAKRDYLLAKALGYEGFHVEIASYSSGLHYLQTIWPDVVDLCLPSYGETAERVRRLISVIVDILPDLVIVDEEVFALPLCQHLRIPTMFITNWLDDDNETLGFLRLANKIIVVDIEENWMFPIPISLKGNISFVGPVVDVTQVTRGSRQKIIVTSGAANIFDARFFSTTINALKQLRQYRKLIVCGNLINSLKNRGDDTFEFSTVLPNLTQELSDAAVVISRGGHTTLWEMAALGLPTIAIPRSASVNPYNVIYAKQMAARGFTEWIDEKDLSEESVLSAISVAARKESRRWEDTTETSIQLMVSHVISILSAQD